MIKKVVSSIKTPRRIKPLITKKLELAPQHDFEQVTENCSGIITVITRNVNKDAQILLNALQQSLSKDGAINPDTASACLEFLLDKGTPATLSVGLQLIDWIKENDAKLGMLFNDVLDSYREDITDRLSSIETETAVADEPLTAAPASLVEKKQELGGAPTAERLASPVHRNEHVLYEEQRDTPQGPMIIRSVMRPPYLCHDYLAKRVPTKRSASADQEDTLIYSYRMDTRTQEFSVITHCYLPTDIDPMIFDRIQITGPEGWAEKVPGRPAKIVITTPIGHVVSNMQLAVVGDNVHGIVLAVKKPGEEPVAYGISIQRGLSMANIQLSPLDADNPILSYDFQDTQSSELKMRVQNTYDAGDKLLPKTSELTVFQQLPQEMIEEFEPRYESKAIAFTQLPNGNYQIAIKLNPQEDLTDSKLIIDHCQNVQYLRLKCESKKATRYINLPIICKGFSGKEGKETLKLGTIDEAFTKGVAQGVKLQLLQAGFQLDWSKSNVTMYHGTKGADLSTPTYYISVTVLNSTEVKKIAIVLKYDTDKKGLGIDTSFGKKGLQTVLHKK